MSELLRVDFTRIPSAEFHDRWKIVEPIWKPSACETRLDADGLTFSAPREPYAVGSAVCAVSGIVPGRAYAVEASASVEGVPSPFRSVFASWVFYGGGRRLHQAGAHLNGPVQEKGVWRFADVFAAPDGADSAELVLEVHWLHGGTVAWKSARVAETPPPPPRIARVGTVYLRPQNSSPERNLERYAELVDRAGELGLDIVCLPEAMTMIGTPLSAAEVAEPIPGPSTERIGAAAKKNKIWVVGCVMETAGDRLYNTAFLVDREGNLAGIYRKTHLPREEWRWGVSPGEEYPVFQTDFGTIAMQICYDWFFPEPHAIFAMKGAEIIFAPTWGTTFKDEDGRAEGETVFRVRARDNGVYMVPSVYDGSSMVIDPMGRILATNDGKDGVFWAEIDLNRREPLWWVGHWRSLGPRHRMPQTYGALTELS